MRLFLCLTLSVGPVGEASPSEKPPVEMELVTRIEKTVLVQEPDWILDRSANSGDHVIRVWKRRQPEETAATHGQAQRTKGVSVQVFALLSAEGASEELRKSIRGTSAPGGIPFDNLGEEAYIWENYNGRGATTLRFRTDNLMIWVSAPTPDVTKRFAQRMVDTVIEHERALEARRPPR